MSQDRTLLEQCLRELERPSGAAPALVQRTIQNGTMGSLGSCPKSGAPSVCIRALVAAIKARLGGSDEVAPEKAAIEIGTDEARSAKSDAGPVDGPDTLWDTNKALRTE